jgi:hypothetical protein
MAIKSFGSDGNVIFLSFTQKYGMLIRTADREKIKKIEGQWKNEGFIVENNTPFSPELQKKLANALRAEQIEPVRSVDGVFESLTNSVLKYKVNNQAQESEQIKLILADGDEKYAICLDRESEAAALLVIGVVDNLKLNGFYEIALYNKLDDEGYKRSHVILKDQAGQMLRSQTSTTFDTYVNYLRTAREKGIQWAQSQGLRDGSRDFKETVAKTISRHRANFVTQLVERSNLSGAVLPSVGADVNDERFESRLNQHSRPMNGQQRQMPNPSNSQQPMHNDMDDGFVPYNRNPQQRPNQQGGQNGGYNQTRRPQNNGQGFGQPTFHSQSPNMMMDDDIPF